MQLQWKGSSLKRSHGGSQSLEHLTATLSTIAQTWEKLHFRPAGRWIFNNAPVTQCFGPGKISRPYLQLIRPTDHNLRLTTQENDDIKPLSADGHLKKLVIASLESISHQMGTSQLNSRYLKRKQMHSTTHFDPPATWLCKAQSCSTEPPMDHPCNMLYPHSQLTKRNSLKSNPNYLGHTQHPEIGNLSTEIWHGPIEIGGLALIDLCTEVGIPQLKYMDNATFSKSEAG